MAVGGPCEFFDIQHRQGRVGDGLAVDGLGVGPERGVQLLLGAVGMDKGKLHAHFLHGDGEEVEAAAVDGGRTHHMVAAGGDIEDGEEHRRHAGRRQHSRRAALQCTDFGRHVVTGGVFQAGIEIAVFLQVKQPSQGLAAVIAEGGGLDDGDGSGFAVAGDIAALEAAGFNLVGIHTEVPPVCEIDEQATKNASLHRLQGRELLPRDTTLVLPALTDGDSAGAVADTPAL